MVAAAVVDEDANPSIGSMLPLEQLAQTTLADGTSLELSCRGEDYYLHADRRLILSSATQRFDQALARICVEACRRRRQPRILLGSLGLGDTLKCLLDELPEVAHVVVAEENKTLLGWHQKGLLGSDCARALRDERVTLAKGSLFKLLSKKHEPGFDVMLNSLDEEFQSDQRPSPT